MFFFISWQNCPLWKIEEKQDFASFNQHQRLVFDLVVHKVAIILEAIIAQVRNWFSSFKSKNGVLQTPVSLVISLCMLWLYWLVFHAKVLPGYVLSSVNWITLCKWSWFTPSSRFPKCKWIGDWGTWVGLPLCGKMSSCCFFLANLLFCADPGFAKTSPTTEDQRTKSNLSGGTEAKKENKSSHAILEEILKKLYAVCNKIFFAKNLVLERKPANTQLRSLRDG